MVDEAGDEAPAEDLEEHAAGRVRKVPPDERSRSRQVRQTQETPQDRDIARHELHMQA